MNPKPPTLSPLEPTMPVPDVASAPSTWQPPPPVVRDTKEMVRKSAIALALAFLAISLIVAYYSANSIVSIWFEHQWVPVARLVLALGVAAVAIWVVLRLTRKT